MSDQCKHETLFFIGNNYGVMCGGCGAKWRRVRTIGGSSLELEPLRAHVNCTHPDCPGVRA